MLLELSLTLSLTISSCSSKPMRLQRLMKSYSCSQPFWCVSFLVFTCPQIYHVTSSWEKRSEMRRGVNLLQMFIDVCVRDVVLSNMGATQFFLVLCSSFGFSCSETRKYMLMRLSWHCSAMKTTFWRLWRWNFASTCARAISKAIDVLLQREYQFLRSI